MSKRTFTIQEETLRGTIRTVNSLYVEICVGDIHGGSFIEECYNKSMKHPRDIIEKLFFEKTTQKTIEEFANIANICDLYRFKEVYHRVGKYGVKNFCTVINNAIVLI